MFEKRFLPFLSLLIFSQFFLGIPKAESGLLGDYTTSYKPIKVEQRRTAGGGSRKCQNHLPENSVSLLVPEAEVVHQTSSATPSLFLYSKVASNLPFKFTLVNPQVDAPLVEQTFSISQPGIKRIKLPKSTRLEPGTIYLWNVAIPCQQGPLEYEVLRAAIERVPVSTKVTKQLQQTDTNEETAAVYASNGIWYEALDFAVSARDRPEYLERLLANVGLVFE